MFPTTDNRGFTLIELMVVITLIGIVSTTVAVRIDMFGTDRNNELERLLTFARSQHARSFQGSHTILLEFQEDDSSVTATTSEGEKLGTITLSQWSIETSSSSTVRLTPWAVKGGSIQLESGGEKITLVPHPTRTLTEQS